MPPFLYKFALARRAGEVPPATAAEVKKKVMSGLVSAAGNLYKRRPKHIQAKVDIAAGGT
jgi:hypothetical protein